MGRRIRAAAGLVLLGVLLGLPVGCADQDAAPTAGPVKTYPAAFDVPDPAWDAESTADGTAEPPNVDLLGIGAAVGYDGIRLQFRYAEEWTTEARARWGARFEVVSSDRRRISGAFTYDPDAAGLVRAVRLVPAPAGCTGSATLDPRKRLLTLALSPGCLPAVTSAEPRPWIRFDSLEAVTSWHEHDRILYGWDQLYARVVAPEPERLYLPD